MKKLLILAGLAGLSGCSAQTDDLVNFVVQVKQNTSVNIEPYPEFKTMPAFKYSAMDIRSPFQRPKNVAVQTVETKNKNCLQPDYNRRKQPLEAYGLDALSISGMFTSKGKKWALITANDGTLHKATLGDHLGLFFGRITSIKDGSVELTEMLPDGAGCWQKKQATLTMSAQTGDNDNV